jgi:cysteine desulfurase
MYFDNNASTLTDPEINKLFQEINSNIGVGNPHSAEHQHGWNADSIIEDSKHIIANYINALPDEIYFTSGATESNNWAIIGAGLSAIKEKSNRTEIIVSSIEHKCVLNAAHFLKEFHGFDIKEAPINDQGIVDLEKLQHLVTDRTLLVSIMAANNEIGTFQPIDKIGHMCRGRGTIFHVDGAQGAYSNLDVIKNNIDMLSLSGHKIYAPKGIGCLYISEDLKPKPIPLMHGGHQQNGLRAGTLSPALCRSLAKALEILEEVKDKEIKHLKSLRSQFLSFLNDNNIAFEINGDMNNRHPGNLNIQLIGVDAKTFITRLQPNIAISSGSACNAGTFKSSYVLKALGLKDHQINCSFRIGFGRFNTEYELEKASSQILKILK